jgi:predicted nucleic acid-binding protein
VLIVDTNVLVDVLQDDAQWADWSVGQLRAQSKVHDLVINPVIYAELSLMFESVDALEESVERMGLRFQELPRAAFFLAGKAFCATGAMVERSRMFCRTSSSVRMRQCSDVEF